jgi:site-specific DNA-cytosine methylase
MKVLELFCGTKSFANVCKERGHEVFTVDNDSQFKPDLCIDIMKLTPEMIPFKPDVIWASPPCQCFSVASIGSNWKGNYEPKRKETKDALEIVMKTLQLIKQLQSDYYFIENPRGVLRKMFFMNAFAGIPKTVTYCQYGDSRMKPTDIWTNCDTWIPK